jgi:hypothetical protein
MANEPTPRPAATSSSEADIDELVSRQSSGAPATIEMLPVVDVFDDGEVEQFIAFFAKMRRARLTCRARGRIALWLWRRSCQIAPSTKRASRIVRFKAIAI